MQKGALGREEYRQCQWTGRMVGDSTQDLFGLRIFKFSLKLERVGYDNYQLVERIR